MELGAEGILIADCRIGKDDLRIRGVPTSLSEIRGTGRELRCWILKPEH